MTPTNVQSQPLRRHPCLEEPEVVFWLGSVWVTKTVRSRDSATVVNESKMDATEEAWFVLGNTFHFQVVRLLWHFKIRKGDILSKAVCCDTMSKMGSSPLSEDSGKMSSSASSAVLSAVTFSATYTEDLKRPLLADGVMRTLNLTTFPASVSS